MSSLASEVIGVTEIPHNTKVPFILVRKSCQEGKETVILQAGVGVTFQVVNRICINACWMFLLRNFFSIPSLETFLWLAREDWNTTGLRRRSQCTAGVQGLSLLAANQILFSPGPTHKLSYQIIKDKFSSYNSVMWKDG